MDENGNRKQKWETYQTLPEAKRRKLELEYKALKGEIVIPNCRTLEGLLQFGKTCPNCGSGHTWLKQGQEFLIKEIECSGSS